MSKNESYEEFVEKFKLKKTTDDCYTPPLIYEAVADWVAEEYELNKADFVRPFYPGGDYKSFDYNGMVVVDNPPFSIEAQILDFYISHCIPFFLFAPNLTIFATLKNRDCTVLITDNRIVYDNSASVQTSFITNLEPKDLRFRTAPTLHKAIKQAAAETKKEATKQLPKYSYPAYVTQAVRLCPYARLGIEIRVPKSESVFISGLDSQRQKKKAIFGGGFLVSERCAAEIEKAEREKAEREKAEREKAERWQLSERELKIIQGFGEFCQQNAADFQHFPPLTNS